MSRTQAGTRAGPVISLAGTAQFLDVLGVTVLVVALPQVQRDLRLDAPELSWVAAGYALLFGGCLVLGGRTVDLLGARPVFVAGGILVGGGALGCALAGSGTALLAGRAVQGLGAALSVPAALAAILAALPPGPRRVRALGWWTMAGALGGACGFVLGGVVTQAAGWRALFLAIGPLALAAAGAGRALLPPGRRDRGTRSGAPAGRRTTGAGPAAGPGRRGGGTGPRRGGALAALDLPGVTLSAAAVVALLAGLTRAGTAGFASPGAWLPLCAAALCGVAFALVERRVRAPVVPPGLWRVRSFRLGAGVALVLTATTSGASVVGSLYLQHVLDLPAGPSGAAFLLVSLGVVAGSTVAPGPVRRLGAARVMAAGLAVVAAALAVQGYAVAGRGLVPFLVGLAGCGLGLGTASVASTAHGTRDAGADLSGVVGGLLNAAAQTGTAAGIAVLLVTATRWAGSPDAPGGQVAALALAAGAALAASAVALLVHRPHDRPPGTAAASGPPGTAAASGPPGTAAGSGPPGTAAGDAFRSASTSQASSSLASGWMPSVSAYCSPAAALAAIPSSPSTPSPIRAPMAPPSSRSSESVRLLSSSTSNSPLLSL